MLNIKNPSKAEFPLENKIIGGAAYEEYSDKRQSNNKKFL